MALHVGRRSFELRGRIIGPGLVRGVVVVAMVGGVPVVVVVVPDSISVVVVVVVAIAKVVVSVLVSVVGIVGVGISIGICMECALPGRDG